MAALVQEVGSSQLLLVPGMQMLARNLFEVLRASRSGLPPPLYARADRPAMFPPVSSLQCDGAVFTRLEAGYLHSFISVGIQISWELPTFRMAERCRMSRKDAINSLFLGKTGAASSGKASPARDPERVRSGAIGAMGVSLKELTQGAREAAKLQEQLNSGEHVVLLSPDQIDSSPIADRLPADNDPSYQALRDSIEANGQQIPILVRPSPTAQ